MRKRAMRHASNMQSGRSDKTLPQRLAGKSGANVESARSIAQAALEVLEPVSIEQAEASWTAALPAGP